MTKATISKLETVRGDGGSAGCRNTRAARAAAIMLICLLGGCSMLGGEPGGPGNTDAAIAADGSMHYRSGKDFALIRGKFSRPDGLSGEFEAHGVDATSGLKIQAETMAKQADMINKLLDQLAPLLKGALGGAGLPGAPPSIR